MDGAAAHSLRQPASRLLGQIYMEDKTQGQVFLLPGDPSMKSDASDASNIQGTQGRSPPSWGLIWKSARPLDSIRRKDATRSMPPSENRRRSGEDLGKRLSR